mgnify:CR=1 FL=1
MSGNNPSAGKQASKGPKQEPVAKQEVVVADEADEAPSLALGRVVYYVTGSGTVRPAVITQINDDAAGDVDLTVFNSSGATPVKSVLHDEGLEPGTYHWPEVD